MARLPRPYVPLRVRCLVVLRQLGEMWPAERVDAAPNLSGLLAGLLGQLAALLGCQVGDLHLDHDPALGARDKVMNNIGEIVAYRPHANDPVHLIYREAGAHRVKTLVRGEHGQHPDRVLIARQRRRERPARAKPKTKWSARPLKSRSNWPTGRGFR